MADVFQGLAQHLECLPVSPPAGRAFVAGGRSPHQAKAVTKSKAPCVLALRGWPGGTRSLSLLVLAPPLELGQPEVKIAGDARRPAAPA